MNLTEVLNGSVSMVDALEFMRASLAEQGCRAANENGGCEYRTAEGKKCAIGFLIPDNEYRKTMSGDVYLLVYYYFNENGASYIDVCKNPIVQTLSRAQAIHDNNLFMGDINSQFIDLINEVKEHEASASPV